MKKVLIDSDVLLDFVFQRNPFFESSAEIFNLCIEKKIMGFVTPVIVCNAHYIALKAGISKSKMIDFFKEMFLNIDIANGGKISFINALEADFNDFEDAVQNFSAQESGLQFIITRNIKDYKKSALTVMEPEEFLKTFNTL